MSMQISSRFAISIHASEKEATHCFEKSTIFLTISIHASEKEATTLSRSALLSGARFQSTPPRRRRQKRSRKYEQRKNISIHASEKEATHCFEKSTIFLTISIHASEKEATATYCDTSTIMYISSLNNFFVRYF